MKEYNEFMQGSGEWLHAKIGKIGGTGLKKVFSASFLDLIDELISQIGSNSHEENYITTAMQRGIDLEPYVRDLFQKLNQIEIDQIGLCQSDEFNYLVCSPDGFSKCRTIGIEIKCPSTKNHVKYIRMNKLPGDYNWQVINYFLVNEKCEKMYFISFDDRYKPKPYWQKTITREEIEPMLIEARIKLPIFWEKLESYRKGIES